MTPGQEFAFAVKLVLGIEGPDSDNPRTDPNGGLTRFGISQKQNPSIDVASLTVDQAIAFYKENHWHENRCENLPWPISVMVFDSSVNQGALIARRLLQASLGVKVDGIIGPETLIAAGRSSPWDLAARLSAKRGLAYTSDSEWRSDGEGWLYRVARVSIACARQPT
jgi:lysozyme family protein